MNLSFDNIDFGPETPFSDLVLKVLQPGSVDSTDFHVHKIVVCQQSKHFAEMVKGNPYQSELILEEDKVLIQRCLEYLYGRRKPFNQPLDEILELIPIAEKYHILPIQKICLDVAREISLADLSDGIVMKYIQYAQYGFTKDIIYELVLPYLVNEPINMTKFRILTEYEIWDDQLAEIYTKEWIFETFHNNPRENISCLTFTLLKDLWETYDSDKDQYSLFEKWLNEKNEIITDPLGIQENYQLVVEFYLDRIPLGKFINDINVCIQRESTKMDILDNTREYLKLIIRDLKN